MRALAPLVLAAVAFGQDLGAKAPPQREPIAIVGATVHTVSGEPIPSGFVLFDEGRIVAVGAGPRAFAPNVRIVDGAGKQVYPGFVCVDTQLGLVEIAAVRATRDFDEAGAISPEVRAAVAVNPDSTLLPVARSNGVLVAGVFPAGGLLPGRASVLRLEGWTWEEMAILDSAGIVVDWPVVRPVLAPWMPKSAKEQRERAVKDLRALREAFASARAYVSARGAGAPLPVDVRWEALAEAFLPARKPVFVRAQDYDQIVSAVTFAAEFDLKLVVVGGRDAPLCLDLLKRHDVAVCALGTVTLPKRQDSFYDEVYRLPAALEASGIRWCLQSGEEAANERNLPYSAAMAVAHGLDRAAAIRSITLSAARILGVDDRYGSLEAGKSATLFLCDGDPLEVPTRVERAFIDGREIDLSNKQTKLAEKYRRKYTGAAAESDPPK